MTNLEYLRTLEAEELAQVIRGGECETCVFSGKSICCGGSCDDGFIEWLKQEQKPELKPCPFCGGEARLYNPLESTMHFVYCNNCSAQGRGNTKAEAIEAWNRRVEE